MADTDVQTLLALTKNAGFRDDYDRGSQRLIQDIRKEKLGRYTLDPVPQTIQTPKSEVTPHG